MTQQGCCSGWRSCCCCSCSAGDAGCAAAAAVAAAKAFGGAPSKSCSRLAPGRKCKEGSGRRSCCWCSCSCWDRTSGCLSVPAAAASAAAVSGASGWWFCGAVASGQLPVAHYPPLPQASTGPAHPRVAAATQPLPDLRRQRRCWVCRSPQLPALPLHPRISPPGHLRAALPMPAPNARLLQRRSPARTLCLPGKEPVCNKSELKKQNLVQQ